MLVMLFSSQLRKLVFPEGERENQRGESGVGREREKTNVYGKVKLNHLCAQHGDHLRLSIYYRIKNAGGEKGRKDVTETIPSQGAL